MDRDPFHSGRGGRRFILISMMERGFSFQKAHGYRRRIGTRLDGFSKMLLGVDQMHQNVISLSKEK